MRRRSGALDADTCEEYVSKYYQKVTSNDRPRAKTETDLGQPSSQHNSPKDKRLGIFDVASRNTSNLSSEHKIKPYIYKNRVDSPELSKRSLNFDGFDFGGETAKGKLSKFCRSGSSNFSSLSQKEGENEDENQLDCSLDSSISKDSTAEEPYVEEVPKSIENKRIMIIGQHQVGRHSFVNALFPDSLEEKYENRGPMDLMIKRVEGETSIVNYHFWMKHLADNNFQNVVDVYYKFIDLFIFMFSLTDKSSFEGLDKSIEQAKLRSNKFRAILIGFKSDVVEQRAVSTEEAETLKQKHGLELFMESNHMDPQMHDNFVSLFNSQI